MLEMIVDALYVGETSRTIGVRSNQHLDDIESSSFMWDHHINEHGQDQIDPENDYTWSLLDRVKDPITILIKEAVRIEEALSKGIHHAHLGQRKIKSLNRKEEHFQARKRPENYQI